MSATHSQGKWTMHKQVNGWKVVDERGHPVAHGSGWGIPDLMPEALANGQLVSAAPVLLGALRELHRVCVGMDHPDQMQRPEEEEYLAAVDGAADALKLVEGQ